MKKGGAGEAVAVWSKCPEHVKSTPKFVSLPPFLSSFLPSLHSFFLSFFLTLLHLVT